MLKTMTQNLQHTTISETWKNLSFPEQMANIGSEVERAIKWKEKNNQKFSQKAFFRALELFDLTLQNIPTSNIQSNNNSLPKITEISRSKETFADFFIGENIYNSTKENWQKYFKQFNYLARKNI
jgi:hypothetical protein